MIVRPDLAPALVALSADPASLEWRVERTVSQHLQRDLTTLSFDGWHVLSAHFQGGRDWTLVAARQVESAAGPL